MCHNLTKSPNDKESESGTFQWASSRPAPQTSPPWLSWGLGWPHTQPWWSTSPVLSGFKVDSAKGSPTGDWREEEPYFLGINSLDCLLQGDLVTALLKAGLIILGERLSPYWSFGPLPLSHSLVLVQQQLLHLPPALTTALTLMVSLYPASTPLYLVLLLSPSWLCPMWCTSCRDSDWYWYPIVMIRSSSL